MEHAFLVGDRLYLRGVERNDLSGDYFQWLNDHEVTRYLEVGSFPNSQEAMEAYYQSIVNSTSNVFLAIVLKENDRHIGNVKLGPIKWLHRRADFSIIIGAKDCWSNGYGSEATKLLLEHAFKVLNLNKVTLGVVSEHKAAIRVYEKLGFEVEGEIPEYLFIDGEYKSNTFMGITAKKYFNM